MHGASPGQHRGGEARPCHGERDLLACAHQRQDGAEEERHAGARRAVEVAQQRFAVRYCRTHSSEEPALVVVHECHVLGDGLLLPPLLPAHLLAHSDVRRVGAIQLHSGLLQRGARGVHAALPPGEVGLVRRPESLGTVDVGECQQRCEGPQELHGTGVAVSHQFAQCFVGEFLVAFVAEAPQCVPARETARLPCLQ